MYQSKIKRRDLRMPFMFGTAILLTFRFGFYAVKQPKDERLVPESKFVKLVVLDPAHPHGAHMQLSLQKAFNRMVHVYAPAGPELEENYLSLIKK